MTATISPCSPAGDQLPEDVGKSGPLGLLLTVLLLIAVVLLVRSMTTHLKRIPASFDPVDDVERVPDTPAELVEPRPQPGESLLDSLRRAPRAIEPPRDDGRRPGRTPRARGADRDGRRRVALPAVRDVDHEPRVCRRLRGAVQGEHPERQPRPHAQGRGWLALERAGPGDLAEGRVPGDVHDLPGLAGRRSGSRWS